MLSHPFSHKTAQARSERGDLHRAWVRTGRRSLPSNRDGIVRMSLSGQSVLAQSVQLQRFAWNRRWTPDSERHLNTQQPASSDSRSRTRPCLLLRLGRRSDRHHSVVFPRSPSMAELCPAPRRRAAQFSRSLACWARRVLPSRDDSAPSPWSGSLRASGTSSSTPDSNDRGHTDPGARASTSTRWRLSMETIPRRGDSRAAGCSLHLFGYHLGVAGVTQW